MKLIKLTDDHYVVVTDEPIEWRDYFLNTIQKEVYCHDIENYDVNKHYLKKITHSTNIDWNDVYYIPLQEVKELIGEVDVEKKAFNYTSSSQAHRRGFIDGYNQAIEDKKEKKYTEEQMRECWRASERFDRPYNEGYAPNLEEFIQSLQPKTEWEVEIVDGKLKLK